jgi:hypothetical protein
VETGVNYPAILDLPSYTDISIPSQRDSVASKNKGEGSVKLLSLLYSEEIVAPRPIPASWVGMVEQRIRNSVGTQNDALSNDGETIVASVALNAIDLFQNTWDVLPGEPYIYASSKGDLVAEFKATQGSLMSIIAEKALLLFTVVNGDVSKDQWEDTSSRLNDIRNVLKRRTAQIQAKDDGTTVGA